MDNFIVNENKTGQIAIEILFFNDKCVLFFLITCENVMSVEELWEIFNFPVFDHHLKNKQS